MDGKLAYTECELRYLDQGYDIENAAAACAGVEKRSSDEGSGESSQKEDWDEFWGET